jgi:hypothetical protein
MLRLSALFASASANLRAHAAPADTRNDPAQHLLQRADSLAGRNPLEAQELRRAASAYMRVVR